MFPAVIVGERAGMDRGTCDGNDDMALLSAGNMFVLGLIRENKVCFSPLLVVK